ncbi:uncharacterized protein BXZ73DRAFT_88030 [Epithele typhae]|uniref:uncharacterized protein n=1 Tax=Epithele typhae TaxID=378194 RepID=UPI0020085A0D|nr:uncharacterized protein BXZ73DRAFT_88030 [Epithele typhae]KAH9942459.1 hypothetical protein BXZ73DRAFT_88030 [Epithele typhae]
MLPVTLWLFLLSLIAALARAQGPVQSFFPAAVPLSVRSPYLSVWLNTQSTSPPASDSWPAFQATGGIYGWAGKIRVDGTAYAWLGADRIPANQSIVNNVQITPTRTIYVMQAGPMNVTVTFLSPIEPDDWVRQSMPFSYVAVDAVSTDGNAHSVQVYCDISAEWVSGNRSSLVKWNNQITASSVFHQIELQDPQANVENSNQAQDGTAYIAMASRPGLTWQIDTDTTTRTQFATAGALPNTMSTAFASISPVFSVFAISVDLGTLTSFSSPVSWTVGYVRDPVVQFTNFDGSTENRRPYYVTQYSDVGSLIDAFTGDYANALSRAEALDQKIMADAAQVSQHYVDLVSLSARQTVGSIDITVGVDSSKKPDPTDVKIFMKDVGTSRRVNPVENMYAAFPTFLYLNASLGAQMLAPLLEVKTDIGLNYPIASGTRGAHQQGIEQSSNMLIMMLAQARTSGDGTLLGKHYNLTMRWADYLVNNTLTFSNQASADGETSANMTNLAIKGIIAVKAMAEISRAVGKSVDAQTYDAHASALVNSWQSLAASSDQGHLLGLYSNQQSWALLYNIYADRLLGTGLVSSAVLDGQTQFYNQLLPQAPAFGLPIDSTAGSTSSMAWTLFTAATVTDTGVRNQFIQGAWARANSNATAGALPDDYDDNSGRILNGPAGPAVGAMFAPLALNISNVTITVPASSTAPTGAASSSNLGPIIGGAAGGVAVLAIASVDSFSFAGVAATCAKTTTNASTSWTATPITSSPSTTTMDAVGTGPTDGTVRRRVRTDPVARWAVPGPPQQPRSDYSANNTFPNPHSPTMSTSTRFTTNHAGVGATAAAGATGAAPTPLCTRPLSPAPPRTSLPSPRRTRSVSGSSDARSQAPTASSREPLSIGPTSMSGQSVVSPTDVLGLRAEVENLRRVMQEIRAERMEPPPEYA